MKARYYTTGKNEIVAVAYYKGKRITAKAKCHPTDEYNMVLGKELAEKRLAYKMATKRIKDCEKAIFTAEQELTAAQKKVKELNTRWRMLNSEEMNAALELDQIQHKVDIG